MVEDIPDYILRKEQSDTPAQEALIKAMKTQLLIFDEAHQTSSASLDHLMRVLQRNMAINGVRRLILGPGSDIPVSPQLRDDHAS